MRLGALGCQVGAIFGAIAFESALFSGFAFLDASIDPPPHRPNTTVKIPLLPEESAGGLDMSILSPLLRNRAANPNSKVAYLDMHIR